MFAYCLNNPINHHDYTGYYTDGQIHDLVIEHIVQEAMGSGRVLLNKRWDTLIIYDHPWRGRWFGFCDIYDPDTGEIWEVKKASKSYTCTTQYALDQLENYIDNGYLVADPGLKRTFPTSSIGSGIFSKTDAFCNVYTISYWEEGNGIIRYVYHVRYSQKQTLLLAAAAMGAVFSILDQVPSKNHYYMYSL